MSIAASFDPAKLLALYFRIARAGSKRFIFKYSAGDPFDISAIEFELIIKRWLDGEETLKLTLGDGLSIGGAGNNELTVELDEDDTNIGAATYFWQLYNATAIKTWLNGDAHFHNGKFDAPTDSETELTITTEGETITITINDGGDITDIDGGTP